MIPFCSKPFSRASLIVLAALLAFTACSREESHAGMVDNYYRISVEPPAGVVDPTFSWEIVDKPEASSLRFFDLSIKAEGKEMTFRPDTPGEYALEMTVFNSEGKMVTDRTYTFVISQPRAKAVVPSPVPPPETIRVAEAEEVPPVDTAQAEMIAALPEETPEVPEETSEIPEELPEPEQPEMAAEKPARTEKEKPEKQAPPVRGRLIEKIEGKWTVQISSWPALEDAQAQAETLRALGFDAYVQKAPFQETDEMWYRVRAGSFSSYSAAAQAAKDIKQATGLGTWVDYVRIDY